MKNSRGRICNFCGKLATAPCEVKKQAEKCPRNPKKPNKSKNETNSSANSRPLPADTGQKG